MQSSDESPPNSIALSDISSLPDSTTDDLVPHQRLSKNNEHALLKCLNAITTTFSTSFAEDFTIIAPKETVIPDANNDLDRELALLGQALHASTEARRFILREGIPFSRPKDFFAEMVKSDEHMDKIKRRTAEELAGNMAAADARRQRNLKKFGKQVQIAKIQERQRAKRETLDKISQFKKSEHLVYPIWRVF